VEALKELRRLFPDGIGHLLDAEGKVDPRHAKTDEDRAVESESAEHVKGWHAAAHRIDIGHAANEPTAKEIEADEKLTEELNSLPTADTFDNYIKELTDAADEDESVETYPEAVDALTAIFEALSETEAEPPDYPDRPDPDEYRQTDEDLDFKTDDPGEYRDHVQSLREEHESRADDFSEDSKTYREEAADATATFREEQTGNLKDLQKAIATALKLPAKEWGRDREAAKKMQTATAALGERVGAILKTLAPDQ
jgi:hypothetical protein